VPAYGLLLMKSLGIPVVATIHHPLPIDTRADLAQEAWRRRLIIDGLAADTSTTPIACIPSVPTAVVLPPAACAR
jgi:hypothetical protein